MKDLLRSSLYICTVAALIIYLIVGCSTISRLNKPTDAEFEKYLAYFTVRTGCYVSYPVFYMFKNDQTVGTCNTWGGLPMYVTINTKHWKYLTESERMLLIFHEAGHCSFSLKHDEAVFEDECPKSLMHPMLPTYFCVKKRGLDYYIDKFIADLPRKGAK